MPFACILVFVSVLRRRTHSHFRCIVALLSQGIFAAPGRHVQSHLSLGGGLSTFGSLCHPCPCGCGQTRAVGGPGGCRSLRLFGSPSQAPPLFAEVVPRRRGISRPGFKGTPARPALPHASKSMDRKTSCPQGSSGPRSTNSIRLRRPHGRQHRHQRCPGLALAILRLVLERAASSTSNGARGSCPHLQQSRSRVLGAGASGGSGAQSCRRH